MLKMMHFFRDETGATAIEYGLIDQIVTSRQAVK